MSKKHTAAQIQAYNFHSMLPTDPNASAAPAASGPSYFDGRMKELGIENPLLYSYSIPSKDSNHEKWQPIFEKTSSDDIQINYPSLYGNHETYLNNSQKEEPFYRLRYNPNKKRELKYYQPAESGIHIFFPITILDKFAEGTEIETLYAIEGEFKAQAGSMHGLDIVGLGGKDNFKDSEGDLHKDILAIITTCKVKNLVLLLDADVLTIKFDPDEDPDADVSKRLYGFYNTVKRFREVAKGRVRDVYFSHISERYLEDAKGLDDLLANPNFTAENILKDLQKLTLAKAFFSCINISSRTGNELKTYFSLNFSRGLPAAFYARFADQLKDSDFNFSGGRYRFVKEEGINEGGLQMVKSADSFKFIRVACDYFKLIRVPNTNKKGVLDNKRVPWKSGEITRDFVQGKGMKNFFQTIEAYDAFCNVPDHTSDHQAVIENCYNLYSKIDHEPEAGDWSIIKKYLKHVFGEAVLSSGHTNLDLALDYMSILYLKPTQKLPIVCLVNKKKNTGKSTFLWLLKEIFQANTTFIGNEELKDHLNDDWADKLIVGIDEGFIDKKTVLERLKSMSTSSTIKLRGMYAGRQEIPFFAKFALTSNDETNFIAIDDDEARFWVNKVPQLTEDDPDLLEKMIKQIPAFLDYLQTREILHPKKTRHWFAQDLLETEALKNVKNNSRSWLIKEIRQTMKDEFFKYRYHTLVYTVTELMDLLNGGNSGIKFRKDDVHAQLQEKYKYDNIHGRYSMPSKPEIGPDGEILEQHFIPKHGRYFEFKIEDFLTKEEMEEQFSEFYKLHEIADYRESEASVRAKKKASNKIGPAI